MRKTSRRSQKGVALLLSILALLLLSAVAVTMMYMSATETAINANFKAEETQYFAARAGLEETRDRMIPGAVPYSINGLSVGPNPPCPADANCYLPTALPTAGNAGVVYLLQSGVTTTQLFSQTIGGKANPAYDDELCHDYASYGNMAHSASPNVPCTTLPGGVGGGWYSIPALGPGPTVATGLAVGSPGVSAAPNWPNLGATNPLDWKWSR